MPTKVLHPFHLPADYKLAHMHPRPGIEVDSPAIKLMVDFRLHPVMTLSSNAPLQEAVNALKNSHRSVILVVDRSDQLCGVITRQSLSNQAIMKKIGKGRGRDDLQVNDFLIPKESLTALNLQEIENSSVGRVITMLRNEGVSTILVVDDKTREVVGLLSAEEIEKLLGLELKLSYNPSFMEIFDAVMH